VTKGSSGQSIDYSIHSNIIYHFTKYVNWPEDQKQSDFVIAVYGDSPMLEELKKSTESKTVGKQKIVVRKFSSSETNFDCNILFISNEKSSSLKKIIELIGNKPVLIVTEEEDMCKKGSCINFVIDDDRTKLEFNTNNIYKRNLKIATELLALGSVIK
jgi:hypothetical protein